MLKTIIASLVIAIVLGAGMLLMLGGKFWLLLLGLVVYLFLFVKHGCLGSH